MIPDAPQAEAHLRSFGCAKTVATTSKTAALSWAAVTSSSLRDQCFDAQPAQADGDDEQEPQSEPAPATTFPSATAENREIALEVRWLPQSGQMIGASASAIERKESNRL
jgi:hypothetical protein